MNNKLFKNYADDKFRNDSSLKTSEIAVIKKYKDIVNTFENIRRTYKTNVDQLIVNEKVGKSSEVESLVEELFEQALLYKTLSTFNSYNLSDLKSVKKGIEAAQIFLLTERPSLIPPDHDARREMGLYISVRSEIISELSKIQNVIALTINERARFIKSGQISKDSVFEVYLKLERILKVDGNSVGDIENDFTTINRILFPPKKDVSFSNSLNNFHVQYARYKRKKM